MRYAIATIFRDITEQPAVTVPYHELPLLELVHGVGKVTVHKYIDVERDEAEAATMPDMSPESEYERLTAKFGRDPDTRVPYVQTIYGLPAERKLEKAINFRHKPLEEANAELDSQVITGKDAVELRKLAEDRGREAAAAKKHSAELEATIADLQAKLERASKTSAPAP